MNPVLLQMNSGAIIGNLIVIAIIAALVFCCIWFFKLFQKVNALAPILRTNPDVYIEEMELLLKGYIPGTFKTMLLMNIAVSYVEKNDYPSALAAMERAKKLHMKKVDKHMYLLNLAHIYIHLGENQLATEIILANQKKFYKLPMWGNLPMLHAFTQAFVAMESGNWERASTLLIYASTTWQDGTEGVDFSILQDRLIAHEAEAAKEPMEIEITEKPNEIEE